MPAVVVALLAAALAAHGASATGSAQSPYTYQAPSRGGIGKFYLGREISDVMGHQGAAWLERPARLFEERPDEVVVHMELEPDDVVADLGAGTGYFTFLVSPRVPQGRVYAVDIQPEMLDIIHKRMAQRGIQNVTPVLGTSSDPKLPQHNIDVVLMVDAYHEFSDPHAMMSAVFKALKPGGQVVLVEYRAEDPRVPIKRLHKMSVAQARRELEAVGLRWLESREFLPTQHFMVFEKPDCRSSRRGPAWPSAVPRPSQHAPVPGGVSGAAAPGRNFLPMRMF